MLLFADPTLSNAGCCHCNTTLTKLYIKNTCAKGCQSNIPAQIKSGKLSQSPNNLSYKDFLLCLDSYAIHPHLYIKNVHDTGGYINLNSKFKTN